MASSVSSVSSAQMQAALNLQSGKQPPKPAASQSEPPKDTVQLSAAAQKAISGDVDHDGDSH